MVQRRKGDSRMQVMTREQLMTAIPAVTTKTAAPRTSSRYVFMPTMPIVDELMTRGWYPVTASQSKPRSNDGQNFAYHAIRFRQEEDILKSFKVKGDEIFEILLLNAHDGRAALRLLAGIFVFVCGNGLIVSEHDVGSYVGIHVSKVKDMVDDMMTYWPTMVTSTARRVNSAKQITMTEADSNILAHVVKEKIWSPTSGPDATDLLTRHREDSGSLWSTFNVLQENVVKGGIDVSGKKRMTRTRGIRSTRRDVEANTAMWNVFASAHDYISNSKKHTLTGWQY